MDHPVSVQVRTHAKAEVWRKDRADPSGNPISYFEGSTFIEVGGERRMTPERPTFKTLAEADVWFERQTGVKP